MCHKPWPGNQYKGWLALCVCMLLVQQMALSCILAFLCTFLQSLNTLTASAAGWCPDILYSWVLSAVFIRSKQCSAILLMHWFILIYGFSLQVQNRACVTREQLPGYRLSMHCCSLQSGYNYSQRVLVKGGEADAGSVPELWHHLVTHAQTNTQIVSW